MFQLFSDYSTALKMADVHERGNLIFYVLSGFVILNSAFPRAANMFFSWVENTLLFRYFGVFDIENSDYDHKQQAAEVKMSHYPTWSFYPLYYHFSRMHNDFVNFWLHVVAVPFFLFIVTVFTGSFFLQIPIVKNQYTDLFHPFNLIVPLIMLNPLKQFNYWKIDKLVCLCFTLWQTSWQVAAQLTLWEINKGTGSMDLEIFGVKICAWEWSLVLYFFLIMGTVPHHVYLEQRTSSGMDKVEGVLHPFTKDFFNNYLKQNHEVFFVTFEILNFWFGYGNGKELDQVRYAVQEDKVLFRKAKEMDCQGVEKQLKKLQ